MTDKKKGGQRPGAGRPAKLKEPVNKQIRFEKAAIDAIERSGHEVGEFVRVATDERLKQLGIDQVSDS